QREPSRHGGSLEGRAAHQRGLFQQPVRESEPENVRLKKLSAELPLEIHATCEPFRKANEGAGLVSSTVDSSPGSHSNLIDAFSCSTDQWKAMRSRI
ncbi:hypothetical protein, partial [Pandoraea capi]|uniref:hypothetical protein n=1 Tax=Pandoraea capi TaxID=2508286 RepID=UPI001C2DC958